MPAPKAPRKIMIIEDSADIREALIIAFTEEGFRVACAAGGEEAFSELKNFTPEIVLLDMHMPGMSGVEVLKRMRETLDVPILMFTGFGAGDEVREAIAAGATDYVLKDTGIEELFKRIEKHLRQYDESRAA